METDQGAGSNTQEAIDDPSAGGGQEEKERRALVKAEDIPVLIPSPTSSGVRGARRAVKAIMPRFCRAYLIRRSL